MYFSGVLPPPQWGCQERGLCPIHCWDHGLTLPSLLPSLEESIFNLGRTHLLLCFFDCDYSQEFTSKCKANTSRIFRVDLFSDLSHASPEAMHTTLT